MLFVGALNALVVFLALAVLLRQVGDWNVKVWATTLQFLGMLVASGGLLYAYRRAKKASEPPRRHTIPLAT
jgi:membrane protein implicated in regulation of membrane protease activity